MRNRRHRMAALACAACLATAGALGLSTTARASEMVLTATEDTLVQGGSAKNTNFNATGLGTGLTSSGRQTYLQFNLGSLPANSVITGAHFEVFKVSHSGTGVFTNVPGITYFDSGTADGNVTFDETTLTQVNANSTLGPNEIDLTSGGFSFNMAASAPDNAYYSSTPAATSDLTWLQADYNGGGNVVFQLFSPSSGNNGANFFEDKEGGDGTAGSFGSIQAPHLIVDFVPEPSTLALAGIGSLMALRRRHG